MKLGSFLLFMNILGAANRLAAGPLSLQVAWSGWWERLFSRSEHLLLLLNLTIQWVFWAQGHTHSPGNERDKQIKEQIWSWIQYMSPCYVSLPPTCRLNRHVSTRCDWHVLMDHAWSFTSDSESEKPTRADRWGSHKHKYSVDEKDSQTFFKQKRNQFK